MASVRTCKRCGAGFKAENGSRGQWPRFCSDACRAVPPPPQVSSCEVDDCEKPARSRATLLCEMHYYRNRRRGTLTARPWHRRTICAIDGCEAPEKSYGYCGLHATRFRRHGDPHVVLEPTFKIGPEHGSWRGDDAGYEAVHARLVVRQGKADGHSCVDCGRRAAHWSYDHGDEREKQSERGPYTHNLDAYSPRCVSCHKLYDLAHLGRRRAVGI